MSFCKNKCSLALLLAFLIFPFAASASMQEVRAAASDLKKLPLSYGANTLTVAGQEVLITRGLFEADASAWGGDVYSVMVREESDWKIVRFSGSAWASAMITTLPHTGEDSVASVFILTPKTTFDALYVIKAVRLYRAEPRKTNANVTLYRMNKNSDFGTYEFKVVAQGATEKAYASADLALEKEAGLE